MFVVRKELEQTLPETACPGHAVVGKVCLVTSPKTVFVCIWLLVIVCSSFARSLGWPCPRQHAKGMSSRVRCSEIPNLVCSSERSWFLANSVSDVYRCSTHVEQEKGCPYPALATPQLRNEWAICWPLPTAMHLIIDRFSMISSYRCTSVLEVGNTSSNIMQLLLYKTSCLSKTSCHWVAKTQWYLGCKGRKRSFSKFIFSSIVSDIDFCYLNEVFRTWRKQSKTFELARRQERRLMWKYSWSQMIRPSSAVVEMDKPLWSQSKSADVYSHTL